MYTLTHSHIKLNVLYKKQNRNGFFIFFPFTLILISIFHSHLLSLSVVRFLLLFCSAKTTIWRSCWGKRNHHGRMVPPPLHFHYFIVLSEDANQLRIFSTPFVLRICQRVLCHPISVGIFYSHHFRGLNVSMHSKTLDFWISIRLLVRWIRFRQLIPRKLKPVPQIPPSATISFNSVCAIFFLSN